MNRWIWIALGLVTVGLLGYLVVDKPIVRTVETRSDDGKTTRVNVTVVVGIGNTITYKNEL
ncbi:MAG: hypothetical protein SNJ54_07660 [Anaerolineae bacterium]